MGVARIVIDIAVRAGDAARDIDSTASSMDKFKSGMGALAGPAAAAAGAIGGFAAVAVKFASDAQQASGGVNAVFAENAKQVHAWAAESATSVGMSTAAYETMAAGIGGALTGMGVSTDQAATSTQALIQRGADLASVFGGTAADATAAITSAYRGEYDSLQRLIPTINAHAVETRMAADAQAGMTFASDEAAKAAAITGLIMDSSAASAGNFAKEADTVAGSQAIAKAEFENTAAALGEQLLPAVTSVMEWLTKFGKWISEHIPLVTAIAGVIGVLAVAVLAVNAAMAISAAATSAAAIATSLWSAAASAGAIATTAFGVAMAVLTSPITIVIAAIAAVIAIIVLLIKNWDTVSAGAVKAFKAIKDAVTTAIDWVIRKVKEAIKWFGELLSSIPVIGGLFGGGKSGPVPASASSRYWVQASTAPSLAGAGTRAGRVRVNSGPQITVNGALDPVAVARQIDRLLTQQRRRNGPTVA